MQPLQRLDRWQVAPVDGVNMPHVDGPHDAGQAVAEQADGDDGQDDGGGADGEVVEEVLRGEDLDAGGCVGRRRGRDGANGVLLEAPWPVVEEARGADPEGELALPAFLAPSRLEMVAAGEDEGPEVAEEVGDEDDEGALDGDERRFVLAICFMSAHTCRLL